MDVAFKQRFACIVGAPRTGTTSLARFLRTHPSIHFSKLKEPHFFSQFDLNGLSDEELVETVTEGYLNRYFAGRSDKTEMLMEASVTYLFLPEQMKPILRLWPDAKFIIGLRDPMELIPSLHQRLLYLGDENVRDFERAWRLTAERRRGLKIPRSCIEPRWLRYDEVGRLGSYVERFTSVVGWDRCFFTLYDDVIADPARLYAEVLNFLDLPRHELSNPKPQRAGKGIRNGILQRLLMRPPILTRRFMAGAAMRRRINTSQKEKKDRPLAIRAIDRTRKALLKWNQTEAPPVQLSPELRQEIREAYRDDVDLLGRLIGRDLSHWLGGLNGGYATDERLAAAE